MKCSTRSRRASPQSRCTPITAKAFRFKSFRCCVPPAFCGIDAARWTVEGMPEHTAGQPSHSDYLPLFQRGLAPVSMTTRRQLCLVGLDIQSGAGKGCTGATQQMHFLSMILLFSAVQPASLPASVADDKSPPGSFFVTHLLHPVSAATLSVTA